MAAKVDPDEVPHLKESNADDGCLGAGTISVGRGREGRERQKGGRRRRRERKLHMQTYHAPNIHCWHTIMEGN